MLTVVFFALIGGVVSLIGGALLLADAKRAKTIAEYATPFAAGALLAAAFLDLLKEGLETESASIVLAWTLGGLLLFFVLESALHWFHHHHDHNHKDDKVDPTVSLVVIGDTVHNFIDGAAIAAAFLVSVPVGVVTTLAVAIHEIPQEIGDFGLMLKKGLRRRSVLLVNFFSALATVAGAVIFYQLGKTHESLIAILLGVTAGFFIYIAVSDIIPTIHGSKTRRAINIKSLFLLLGVLVVGVTTTVAHNYIDHGHDHDQKSEASQHEHEDDHDHAPDEHDHAREEDEHHE